MTANRVSPSPVATAPRAEDRAPDEQQPAAAVSSSAAPDRAPSWSPIAGSPRARGLPQVAREAKYSVVKNDTLSQIAKMHSVSLEALKQANRHLCGADRKNGDLIFPGDEVIIPRAETPRPAGAPGGSQAAATSAPTPAVGPDGIPVFADEPLPPISTPENASKLAAASASSLADEARIAKAVDELKNEPAALLAQIQSPELIPEDLLRPFTAKVGEMARSNGMITGLKTGIAARLDQPEMKAASENAQRIAALEPQKQDKAVLNLSPAAQLDMIALARLQILANTLAMQEAIGEAKGDPAKLVEVTLRAQNEAQLESITELVLKEAKSLGNLDALTQAIQATVTPAGQVLTDFKKQISEIEKSQGAEAAQKAQESAPDAVKRADMMVGMLAPLAGASSVLKQIQLAGSDSAKLADVVASAPEQMLIYASQEVVTAARAKGPEAVLSLFNALDAAANSRGGPVISALKQMPENQRSDYFAKLSPEQKQGAFDAAYLEAVRDSIRVDAKIALTKSDPAKVLSSVENALTNEEALAVISTALQDTKNPSAKALQDGLMKLTAARMKEIEPLVQRRLQAVQGGQTKEAAEKSFTPEERKALTSYDRNQAVRLAASQSAASVLEAILPKALEVVRLKPNESIREAASRSMNGQLGLGDKDTFARAMSELTPSLNRLDTFAKAVADPSAAHPELEGIPVKALLDGLTPLGGTAELVIPPKQFELIEGDLSSKASLGMLSDSAMMQPVLVKVTDANNDVKFYALPSGNRRVVVGFAGKLRTAFEKANSIGDGSAGLFERVSTGTNGSLPTDATQAQLNATFEWLKANDPPTYAAALKEFARPATLTDAPLNVEDLGVLLKDARGKKPDDFMALVKGIIGPEKLKDPKDLVPELKRLSSGTAEEKAKFRTLQERAGSFATAIPVAAIRFDTFADGKPAVTLTTSLTTLKAKSTILADVDLERMAGFAKAHGEDYARSLLAGQLANRFGPEVAKTDSDLDNLVGDTLEMGISEEGIAWAQSPEAAKGGWPDFVVFDDRSLPTIKAVTDQIRAITAARGPNVRPEFEVIQLIHLMKNGRTMPVKLFKVTGKNGPMFVDMRGATYTSFEHYKTTNQEMSGTIYGPANGEFTLDENGQVKVDSFLGGMTITTPFSMNWANENLLTVRVMDTAAWVLTGTGVAMTFFTLGASTSLVALGQAIRVGATTAVTKSAVRRGSQRLAGEALFHTAKWGNHLAAPVVRRLGQHALGRFAMNATGKVALGGGAAFMGQGLANLAPQIGWVNSHSQLGAWDTWSPAFDLESQEGYQKRQILAGSVMLGLGVAGMGSGLALARVLGNPAKTMQMMGTTGGKALANTALITNAANLPLTGFMTWDMYNFRNNYGGLMDDDMRRSLDANVLMNSVGAVTGLLTAVDVNALRLRGTHIPERHMRFANQVGNANPIERLVKKAQSLKPAKPMP